MKKYDVKEIIPCEYSYVENFSEGLAYVSGNRIDGFIDKTGELVIPCSKYKEVCSFSDGLAAVKIGDSREGTQEKWGFIDHSGNEVIPCQYDIARNFHDGVAVVGFIDAERKRFGYPLCKWGCINRAGEEVIPFGKYGMIGCHGDYGYRDSSGYYGTVYDEGRKRFFEGMASVWSDSKPYIYGYVDKNGAEVVPLKYNSVDPFSNGLAIVRISDGKDVNAGYIDKEGNVVIPFKYLHPRCFLDDITTAYTKKPYKPVFIDKKGNEVFPFKYDDARPFTEGMGAVLTGDYKTGKWGFIRIK